MLDGYDEQNSMKKSEHQRRNKHFSPLPQIQITASSTIYANQESFLANSENEKQLVKVLAALENQHIKINQCEGDVVIVQTALEMSQKGYPNTVT